MTVSAPTGDGTRMGWAKTLDMVSDRRQSRDGRVSQGQLALHVALSLKAHYSITDQ